MPLTIADVRARAFGDPTIDPLAESAEEITEVNGTLIIKGVDDGGKYRDDLMMAQNGDSVRLWVKAPKETHWRLQPDFDDFEELHTWIYEL